MYKRGTIVLVLFPFTDLTSSKLRPALIVSSIQRGDDIIVAFISSNFREDKDATDLVIKSTSPNFKKTGLKSDSTVRLGKLATLEKKVILGEIGAIDISTQRSVDKALKLALGLY